METLVLSAQDCPKDGGPKGGVPRMFAWQGDEYTYCSHIDQTCSDLSEQMHAICGYYMPADGSRSITEKHFFFATSVIECGTSRCNNMEYPAAPTWQYSIASSHMNHQSREIHWGMQGCRSGSALRGWTFTKARNYAIMGHTFCRTTPMARASSLELFMRESPPTHSLQPPNTRKYFTNMANKGRKERSSPTTHKFSSCKDSDICARGVVDEAHSMSYEPMRNRLANKAPKSDGKVGCIMPQTASVERHQMLSVRANSMKKDDKEPLASINGAPLDRLKAGQEWECFSSPSSRRGVYKDHCNGLMPFDAVVTSTLSTPLAIKGHSQEGSQSAHSPPIKGYSQEGSHSPPIKGYPQEGSYSVHSVPMKERWAGPAFSNSPPPSSLPLPTFTRRQLRTSSLEIPCTEAEFLAH